MSEIHGLAVHAAGAHLLPYKYDPGELQANEVEIRISHCGVCHSDVHLIDNDWGFSKFPFIPGHEIVGTVVTVGSSVRDREGGRAGWGGLAGGQLRPYASGAGREMSIFAQSRSQPAWAGTAGMRTGSA